MKFRIDYDKIHLLEGNNVQVLDDNNEFVANAFIDFRTLRRLINNENFADCYIAGMDKYTFFINDDNLVRLYKVKCRIKIEFGSLDEDENGNQLYTLTIKTIIHNIRASSEKEALDIFKMWYKEERFGKTKTTYVHNPIVQLIDLPGYIEV